MCSAKRFLIFPHSELSTISMTCHLRMLLSTKRSAQEVMIKVLKRSSLSILVISFPTFWLLKTIKKRLICFFTDLCMYTLCRKSRLEEKKQKLKHGLIIVATAECFNLASLCWKISILISHDVSRFKSNFSFESLEAIRRNDDNYWRILFLYQSNSGQTSHLWRDLLT